MLFIQDNLVIPDNELSFFTARSGGPGGQHVNTTNSRVCVRFNVRDAGCLTRGQSTVLMHRLKSRLTRDCDLIICSTSSRSQHANKEEVLERLADVIREALKPRKKRIPTKVGRQARERRLQHKRKRSIVKRNRGSVNPDD